MRGGSSTRSFIVSGGEVIGYCCFDASCVASSRSTRGCEGTTSGGSVRAKDRDERCIVAVRRVTDTRRGRGRDDGARHVWE